MEISVTGCRSKKRRDEYKSATLLYGLLLMDPRMVNNLSILIKLHKKLDLSGFCENADDVNPPRVFTIHLRDDKKRYTNESDPFRALAHEMVHVKQYAKGEIKDLFVDGKPPSVLWRGKLWKETKREYITVLDSPWEIEAYGREVGLYTKWNIFKAEKEFSKIRPK
jgi:hypothetical protein